MYNSILYPTDGSEGAECALEHAEKIGKQFDAEVHILFVADTGFGDTPMRVQKDDEGRWTTGMMKRKRDEPSKTKMSKSDIDINDVLVREGEAYTSQLAAELEERGVSAKAVCKRGSAAKTIVNYANESGVGMIVMGTHGRTGLNRRVIGSVTEKVVRTSEVPVLSVQLDN